MTDCLSPTIVQQIIPLDDMTPLEIWLLSLIFDAVRTDDGLHFSAHRRPRAWVIIDKADLREALAASAGFAGTAQQFAAQALQDYDGISDPVEIDVRAGWWDRIFQEIVKRSATLDYISVVMVFTSAKMLRDGLGGLTILITASKIRCKLLDEVLMDLMADAEQNGEIKPIK